MTIQIFGLKKCQETKKVQRFFKERNVSFQFIDLKEKALSPREFERFYHKLGENILDTNSKAYKNGGYAWKEYDPKEEIMENQELLKTPLIRIDNEVMVGYDKSWLGSRI